MLRKLILAAFVISLGVTAFLAYNATRELVASWNLPGFENSPFNPAGDDRTQPAPAGAPLPDFDLTRPLQPPSAPQSRPWDGASRITVLLLGLDYRAWEADYGPARSDALILFTLDPASNTAGMVSIPRDLWVPIPGYGNGKINTAFQLGEAYQVDGGGPGLAIATVELLFGVPVDYYSYVDFNAFVRFVDEIGGVKLEVPEEIVVDLIDGKTKRLKPGIQTLDGRTALAYVRARNTSGGDFDRAERQQQVLMAIRNRILDFNLLPELIAKAPILYNEIASGVQTNLTPNDVIKIALAFQDIPEENILITSIGQQDVIFDTSPEGLDILVPVPDKIRLLRDEVFVSLPPVSQVSINQPIEQLISAEAAKIAVLNGTFTPGLAAQTTELLRSEGLNVTVTDNADQPVSTTTLIDYTGNPYTVQFLVDLLDIRPNRIFHSYDPESDVDIEITLGDDWANHGAQP